MIGESWQIDERTDEEKVLAIIMMSHGRHSVSDHQLECLFNSLFRVTPGKTSELHISLALCEYDAPVAGRFPSQNDNNVERVSILWLVYEYPSTDSKPRQGITALCM